MLAPAIKYKKELEEIMANYFYTPDMVYFTGCKESWLLEIEEEQKDGYFQFAILNTDNKLVGYLGYTIDYYDSCLERFHMITFDRNDPHTLPSALRELMGNVREMNLHRVEFRCVGGNPIKEHYDRIINDFSRYGYEGRCIELRDTFRDSSGIYHNTYIYELVKKEIM